KVIQLQKVWIEKKEQYEQIEEQWFQDQATLLASHLHTGQSCPVCGSTEHPHKSTQTNSIDRQQLHSMKKDKEEVEGRYHQLYATLREMEKELEKKKEEIERFPIQIEEIEKLYQQIVAKGQTITKEITMLQEQQQEQQQIRKKLQQLEKQMLDNCHQAKK